MYSSLHAVRPAQSEKSKFVMDSMCLQAFQAFSWILTLGTGLAALSAVFVTASLASGLDSSPAIMGSYSKHI